MIDYTEGYPVFPPGVRKRTLELSRRRPISAADVATARDVVESKLDGIFRRGSDCRLSPAGQQLLTAGLVVPRVLIPEPSAFAASGRAGAARPAAGVAPLGAWPLAAGPPRAPCTSTGARVDGAQPVGPSSGSTGSRGCACGSIGGRSTSARLPRSSAARRRRSGGGGRSSSNPRCARRSRRLPRCAAARHRLRRRIRLHRPRLRRLQRPLVALDGRLGGARPTAPSASTSAASTAPARSRT